MAGLASGGMAVDRAELNPAQRNVLEGLLAVDEARLPHDAALVDRVRGLLTEATRRAAEIVPPGGRGLYVNKSALDALSCDGRYLDRIDSPFHWSPEMVRGTLAHEGIAVDLAGDRRRDPEDVVRLAWERFAASGRPAGDFLGTLDGVRADALRAQALAILTEFRELFPPLPAAWHPRVEPELRVALHRRRLVLLGKPDLLVGRATVDRRRMLIVDLKTGQRRPARDRADLAFYALLATLKYGVVPFRVATFYLAEGDWDHADVDRTLLEAAVGDVAGKVEIAARLEHRRPPERELRLVPGPACTWCARADGCPALAEQDVRTPWGGLAVAI
jgi:hypothetical protein